MRKVLMLTAAALLVPGVAFADGEEAMAKSGWFYGGAVGWTNMNMPEHGNAALTANYGGGFVPVATTQADVDGVSYGLGIGRDSEGGWRTIIFGGFFTGDGSAADTFTIAAATPTRGGTLGGLTQSVGATAGVSTAHDTLDVRVDKSTWGLSFGRALIDMVRADLVVSYDFNDTAYRHDTALDFGVLGTTLERENTDFETRTLELAARLSAGIPLSSEFSINLAGSAGWGLRDVQMSGLQQHFVGLALSRNSTIKVQDDDLDGFIGRLEGSLNYAISPGMQVGINANYVSDSMVPVFVPPVYTGVVATTGTPASFDTESQSTLTYGVRLIGRF